MTVETKQGTISFSISIPKDETLTKGSRWVLVNREMGLPSDHWKYTFDKETH